MRKFSLTLAIIAMSLIFSGCQRDPEYYQSDVPVTEPDVSLDSISEDSLPVAVNLGVPFFSQAPFGDWGMPYQEACEEASLLLAYSFVTDQSPTIDKFHEELLAMVDWEVGHFGQYEHTTLHQTAEMASLYLGHDSWEILENPTVDDIKAQLAKGYPVVAPFAGRYLGNPYFTGEGPVYHMLVIRGYDDEHFITNDVGTRHGENFTYEYDVLMEALHDWDDSALVDPEGITQGGRRVLVLKPVSVDVVLEESPATNPATPTE